MSGNPDTPQPEDDQREQELDQPMGTSTAASGTRKTGETYEERDEAEGGRA